MERKWVLVLGSILVVVGIIVLIANFVFNFFAAVNGESGLVAELDALSFLLPGIILVGFNRVLNKLEGLKEEKPGDIDYDTRIIDRGKKKKDKHIITNDDQLKDYKYVSRK